MESEMNQDCPASSAAAAGWTVLLKGDLISFAEVMDFSGFSVVTN
jgi:hypothetical protein